MTTIKLYAYFANNLGDDLMVDILLKRFPQCRFYSDLFIPLDHTLLKNNNFVCTEKLYSRYGRINHLLDIVTLGRKRGCFFSKLFQHYERSCSSSVYIGGSLFMQNTCTTVAERIAHEEKRITVHPRYIVGANFGPFIAEEFKLGFAEYFNRCAGVTFRDKYSYNLFSQIEHVSYAPDVVLNLDTTIYSNRTRTNNVIISVIDFSTRQDLMEYTAVYEQYIAECCKEVVCNGDTPVLISFCECEGDENAVQRIFGLLAADVQKQTKIVCYSGDIPEALGYFATAKYVIATRFHAMILALRFHKPFFCIAYNQKITTVLSDLNCSAWIHPSELKKRSPATMLGKYVDPVNADVYIQNAEKQFAQIERVINR